MVGSSPRRSRSLSLSVGLGAARPGTIEALSRDFGGQVFLGHPSVRVVVRIDVALAVSEDLGPAVVRVPQVHRDGTGPPVAHGVGRPAQRGDDAVALRRQAEVDHRVREVDRRLGQPDILHRAGGGLGDEDRLRIGETDVLAREDDHPARDVPRIFAGLQHPREPVEPGVGIGTAAET